MKAERFFGDADGPELVIDRADDGTPLTDCRGWTCGGCDALYATVAEAEAYCLRPMLSLSTGEETRGVNTA
jgi:hypothetical protein